jgi:hypothetical protein
LDALAIHPQRARSETRPLATTNRAAAPRHHQGNQAHLRNLRGPRRMVQRDGPDVPLKEAKKEDAVDPIVGGAKEIASRAADTPQIKDSAVDLAKKIAKPVWDQASTGDKAAIITGGAAIVGTGLAGMLGDPAGRKALSGLPLGAPLSLVPYALFSGFSFDMPKSPSDPLLLHLSFKGDDYLDLLHSKFPSFPKMTLSFDMTLSVSPDYKVTMPFGLIKLSPLQGVTLAGGYGVTSDLPNLISPPGGGPLTPYKSFPTLDTSAPRAGAAGFIAIDFAKIDALHSIFAPLTLDLGDKR